MIDLALSSNGSFIRLSSKLLMMLQFTKIDLFNNEFTEKILIKI